MTDSLTNNPLLQSTGLPAFDRIQPEHVIPAVRHVLANAERQLTELESNVQPTWAGCFAKLEEIDRPFEYGWGPVSHLFGVRNSAELREAYETVLDEVVQFSLRASQSKPIYEACKSLREGRDWATLNDAQQRIVEKKLQSAELSGIGLEGEPRERFNSIVQELSQAGTTFSNNVLDATKAFELVLTDPSDVAGMPESALAMAAQSFAESQAAASQPAIEGAIEVMEKPEPSAESGPWRFTLEGPSYTPFMQHSRKSELREKLYRAFITRASVGEFDNSALIDRTLELRQQKAVLLGFDSFAELSLATKMAPDVAAVEQMFETLRKASWDSAVQDLADVEALAKDKGVTEPLALWDIAFWAERLREKKFDFTDEELRPYFPLERVLAGMFELVERIFGIKVEPENGIAVWHKDVRYFRVCDSTGKTIAGFYLDPYSRPEDKRGGAWMNDCLCRRRIGNELQLPIAHLVCNSTPPIGKKPSLMTFREVETLFHEFGHGLQHMLTTIDESDAAGINSIEWDAVELPSQFMENWCYHRPTLLKFSGHYETGEPLPSELFEKLKSARTFRAGSFMLRQLSLGMTDIQLHSGFKPSESRTVFDVQAEVSQKTSVLPLLPEDRFLCSFTHIFAGGYAAGYYSYKWAEVLSADAFSAFEDAGLDNEQAIAETGRRFRDTVLSLGGSRHPMEIFEQFRGRQPDPAALLRHSGLV